MKKLLLLIALLLPALFVTAQGIKNGLKEEPKINVGIKGGFNSSMYFTSRLELDGERMEDVQNNYKVGYFAAMFFRVHMKRHFIQPEIMYNIYNLAYKGLKEYEKAYCYLEKWIEIEKQLRKTKKRRNYYICENNPTSCDYISWNKPGTEEKKTVKKKTARKAVKKKMLN